MKYTMARALRRKSILDGISRKLSYGEIASRLGIRRRELVSDIKSMRRIRDPDLLEAQRVAVAKVNEEKRSASKKREELFYNMTGMTLREKTFQNMIHFYKPELVSILNCGDQEAAIRGLPNSVRKTLTKNDILTSRGKLEISQRAMDQLI